MVEPQQIITNDEGRQQQSQGYLVLVKLIMMRGLPGSGKSTKARELASHYRSLGHTVHLFSTDDFWGEPYNFVPARLREAHLWNQNRTLHAMIDCISDVTPTTIIVDNTNTCAWEMRDYIKPAVRLSAEVEIVEASAPWAKDAEECAKRTIHGVPVESVRAMLARWEPDLTVEKCLCALAPWERTTAA